MTHSIRIQGPELIDMGYQICEIVPGSKAVEAAAKAEVTTKQNR